MKVRLTVEAVIEVSKEDLRALRIASPHNVTGAIFAEDNVKAQVRVVSGRRLWLWRKT